MFEHYLAALLGLGQEKDLAYPALPDAPVLRDRGDRKAGWQPCACLQWGVARGHRPGCEVLVKELFPQLDRELDAWEAEHGWLYR